MTTRHEFTTEVTNEKEVAKGNAAYRHVHCSCGWSEGGHMSEGYARRDWEDHVTVETEKAEQRRIAAGLPARLEAAEARLVACEAKNEALVTVLIDCRAMLEVYVTGKTNSTTAGQARSCLRDADAILKGAA